MCVAVLGLRCCSRSLSSFGEPGLLSSCGAQAFHCGSFSFGGARAPELVGPVAVMHGLSCPMACGVFLDQGLNLCPPVVRRILNH